MIGTILGILITFASVLAVLYLFWSVFPRYTKLWLAALITLVVLGVIRALHGWLCVLVCG